MADHVHEKRTPTPEAPCNPPCVGYKVSGLDCPDCASSVDKSISYLDGVRSADLNFATGMLVVEYEPGEDPRAEILATLRKMGYGAEPVLTREGAEAPPARWWAQHRHEVTTAVSGAGLVAGWALERLGAPAGSSIAMYVVAIAVGGWITAQRGLGSLRARSLDMNVLMTVAVIGAAAIGQWSEGATVVFLFSLGGLLEARSLARTRRSIRDLMALTPPTARVRRGAAEEEVSPERVEVGDVIVVRPGERIALDGDVVTGASAVDESPITGESVPSEKAIGSPVYAGTLNANGLLEVRVTSRAADSTLARVIYMVEEAQGQRAPLQTLVDRFTRWYTPAVIAAAVAIAVLPPLLGFGAFSVWFYRSLVLLVISCPCALVISTPVAIVSAITRATGDGVLVKGGAFLETAPRVRVVALDKTGTLTRGRPTVAEVVPAGGKSAEEVLRLAGSLEAGSAHPLAAAVSRAAADVGGVSAPVDLSEEPGRGVTATIGSVRYSIGNVAQARDRGVLGDGVGARIGELEAAGRTVLVVSSPESVVGLIGVADEVRPESAAIVQRLRRAGIEHVVMLTGDNEKTAEAVAEKAGVTEVRARLLPADKVEAVRELRQRYGTVAMVGDGVNDAPALAGADIGIAMGAVGSDTALETADVALMADSLEALPGFFDLGRRTVANIKQNVAFSIVVKATVLTLAILGRATLWMAVFADTGVALLVILNGLRLLRPGRQEAFSDGT